MLTALPERDAEAEEDLLRRMASEIVRRRLTVAAVLFLESVKPLNFVGSQFLVFMGPLVHFFVTVPEYGRLSRMLEERDSIERFILAIEEAEESFGK